MKIAVIGGESTYTPELVSGFIEVHRTLPVSELWLMGINEERLRIVGDFAQRMVAAQEMPFEIRMTGDRREALKDASFVITQLRVGGMAARREDEYLGRRHGLIGQETTGIGGMACALRTIPVILEIAREINEISDNALFANFTNPAGLITEAVTRHVPDVNVVGMCNVPITTKMHLLEMIQEQGNIHLDPQDVSLDTLGLNHLSWHRGLNAGGEDYWPQVMELFIDYLKTQSVPDWEPQLIEALGMIPNYYLGYFYNRQKKLSAQESWPPSRAEEVVDIEKSLLQKYAEPSTVELPVELLNRGGAYYSTMATKLLNAFHNDLGEIHVLNVPNRGAVSTWQDDWVLELPCRVNAEAIQPLPAEPLPAICSGLLTQVKEYEVLTVDAAVLGDRKSAFQALLSHPLGPDTDDIEVVLNDMLETNKKYLPQFWH
ncbi:MAG: 6-phospho-beta-glucosidase [Anaerolineales bacterium]|nr:6-phospho-beta-glucosidase [Anaerolineales bacterium]